MGSLQKEEAREVVLLDDDSRAVLGLLQRASATTAAATLAAKPSAGQLPRPNFAHDLTNRPVKVRTTLCPVPSGFNNAFAFLVADHLFSLASFHKRRC